MKRLIAGILSVIAYPSIAANEQQVQELLSRMTLEQKVGQMVQAEIQFITPEQFKEYETIGLDLGFRHVESSALVRSSYKAQKHIN